MTHIAVARQTYYTQYTGFTLSGDHTPTVAVHRIDGLDMPLDMCEEFQSNRAWIQHKVLRQKLITCHQESNTKVGKYTREERTSVAFLPLWKSTVISWAGSALCITSSHFRILWSGTALTFRASPPNSLTRRAIEAIRVSEKRSNSFPGTERQV